jgi:hypothetical protein
VQVPDDVTNEEGVLLGDILPTAFFCAQQGGITPGDVVAVVGCGPVGLLACMAAQHYGASQVRGRAGGRAGERAGGWAGGFVGGWVSGRVGSWAGGWVGAGAPANGLGTPAGRSPHTLLGAPPPRWVPQVFAVDGVAGRRAKAEECGARPCQPEQAVAAVQAATSGRGADVVLEVRAAGAVWLGVLAWGAWLLGH